MAPRLSTALRALPADTFIAPKVGQGNATPPVGPFNDGYVLPADAAAVQVPMMAGFTADDLGTSGQGFGPAAPATVASFTADAEKAYGAGTHTTMRLGEQMGAMPVAESQRLAFHLRHVRK